MNEKDFKTTYVVFEIGVQLFTYIHTFRVKYIVNLIEVSFNFYVKLMLIQQ